MSDFALHALWQPLIVAAAAGGLRLARRLDPASRANLWMLAILLAAIAPAATGLAPAPTATGRSVSVSLAAILVAAGAFFALRPIVRAQHGPPVYRAGGDVSAPRLLHKVEPQYTEAARAERLEGRVTLAAVVGPEGKVTEATVLESLGGGLDEEALAAVHQWQFQPGYRDGQPVPVRATIEVNFRLR